MAQNQKNVKYNSRRKVERAMQAATVALQEIEVLNDSENRPILRAKDLEESVIGSDYLARPVDLPESDASFALQLAKVQQYARALKRQVLLLEQMAKR